MGRLHRPLWNSQADGSRYGHLSKKRWQRRNARWATHSTKSLLEAVTDGALLRLRPKVMTVTTVVAGLLPIMWSSSSVRSYETARGSGLGRNGVEPAPRSDNYAGDLLLAQGTRIEKTRIGGKQNMKIRSGIVGKTFIGLSLSLLLLVTTTSTAGQTRTKTAKPKMQTARVLITETGYSRTSIVLRRSVPTRITFLRQTDATCKGNSSL